MHEELIRELSVITDEERQLLEGRNEIDQQIYTEKKEMIAAEVQRMQQTIAGSNETTNAFLRKHGSAELPDSRGVSFAELIKRPELNYELLFEIDPGRKSLPWRVREQVNIEIKYEGYIRRQMQQVEHFKKLEGKKLPKDINYQELKGLRLEARQKLEKIRPENIGQAGRISGVSPADVSVLMIYLEQRRQEKRKEMGERQKP